MNNNKSEIDPILAGEQRRKCWTLQDKYIACLKEHEAKCIYRDGKQVNFKCPADCAELRDLALVECPLTWIRHFEFKWAKAQIMSKSVEDFGLKSQ